MFKILWLSLAVLFITAMAACKVGELTATPAVAPKPARPEASKPAWAEKWETILAEGKKEGTVRIYTAWSPSIRSGLTEAFAAKYGIGLDFVVGRGAELQPKILAEQRAGVYLVDIIGQGTNSLLVNMKPVGLIGPIEHMLILPEVLDPGAWPDGKVPFSDKDRMVIPMTAHAQRYFTYNKDLIKEGELTSYLDALKPQYKGKVVLGDPSIQGAGNAFFSHLAHNVLDLERAKDFLKRLLTEQEAAITRDYRGQVEAIARGKYAIGLGTQTSAVNDFLALGAPITNVPIKDIEISHEAGVLGVPKVLAHPNATIVFINWLLTAEGQTTFSKNSGSGVIRRGIPTDWINPLFLVQPGDRVTPDSEEYVMFKGEMTKVAKEIVDAYMKQR